MKIELRDPRSLRRHPLPKAHLPAPDKKSPEWIAFADTVHADGRIIVPLIITADGFVMKGWRRREAASDFQFTEVPCIVESSDNAALFLVEGLTARTQMTRGAAVYLAVGVLGEYAKAANARAAGNGIKHRTTTEERIDPSGVRSTAHPSNRYLAKRWGCGETTIRQAHLIRALFYDVKAFEGWCKAENGLHLSPNHAARREPGHAQEQLRALFEPLLFNGEKSLWEIRQAIAGRLTTEGGKPPSKQLELFTGAFDTVAGRLRYWDQFTGADRQKAARAVADLVEAAPDDLAAVIEKALRERRTKTKQEHAS
jgi:hypothetical protein